MLLQIGQEYSGGIVFALSEDKRSGLMVTKANLGADKDYGQGKGLITTHDSPSEPQRLISACRDGGHDDWYLPTLAELKMVWHYLFKQDKGNFDKSLWVPTYLTSCRRDINNQLSIGLKFDSSSESCETVNSVGYAYIRAVRSFTVPVTATEYTQIGFSPSTLSADEHKIGSQLRKDYNLFYYDKNIINGSGKLGLTFTTRWIPDGPMTYATVLSILNNHSNYLPSIGHLEFIYRNCYVYGNMKAEWGKWLSSGGGDNNTGQNIFWSNSICTPNSDGGVNTIWALDFETGIKFPASKDGQFSAHLVTVETQEVSPY